MLAPFKPHCGWKYLQCYYWFGNQVIEKTLSTTHHWGIFPPKHKQQIFERSSAPFSHKEYHPDLFYFLKKRERKDRLVVFLGEGRTRTVRSVSTARTTRMNFKQWTHGGFFIVWFVWRVSILDNWVLPRGD